MILGNFSLPEPLLVWGLFLRCLGLVYFIAIIQLYWQVLPLAGSNGISPVRYKLGQIKRDYVPIKRWLLFPTLLWVNASDRFLKILVITGSVSSLLVMQGGMLSFPALLLCWLVYVSLDIAVVLSYPWDNVLFEAGFLALFLPSLHSLPQLQMEQLPHPAIAWAYRLLLFRLIFGFGKFKFWKSNWRDRGYFHSFMINIPLPSYGAWYLSRLPSGFFLCILYLTFLIEVIVPPLIFLGPVYRLTAAGLITFLMIGIWLISNFGFFNLVTIVICIPLLDVHASVFDIGFHQGILLIKDIFICAIVLVVVVGGLLNFAFNSWCTLTWLHWPSALQIPSAFIRGLLTFYRSILRFHITHSYGVFPNESTAPIKWVPVFEGSNDGIHWLEYEYRFMATNEYSAPRMIAPYHPRLDHAIFYDSYGTNDANFICSLIGSGVPYEFTHATGAESIMQRLLEGNATVHTLFRKIPFSKDAPPKFVRLYFYRFEPVSMAERRLTGKWWHRKPVGIHLPARKYNKRYYSEKKITPELFHWDAVFWKDGCSSIRVLQHTATTQPISQIYASVVKGLAVDIDLFWDHFLPFIEADKMSWNNLPEIRSQLVTKYTFSEIKMVEIIWSRLSIMMEIKLRPHFLKKATPGMTIDSYFIFGLYIHHIIGKGKKAYERILSYPQEVNAFMDDFDPNKAFYFYAVFWYDTLVFQSRKIRLGQRMGTLKNQKELPGFVRIIAFIGKQFIDANEEHWPLMDKNKRNGIWTIADPTPPITKT